MNKAYQKDILRSIQKGWKRFLSIMLITALGVGMLTGLYAACLDMYYSADKFYDEQKLFDIRVLSTLGLTEEDVKALAQVDGVETAEGGYSETAHTDVDGIRKSTELNVLSPKGLNAPFLLEGTLPSKAGEIAVTQKYLEESGKSIGDTLTIKEEVEEDSDVPAEETPKVTDAKDVPDESGGLDPDMDLDMDQDIEMGLEEKKAPTLANTSYTITGAVLDPMDIQGSGAENIFRSSASTDYTFFITPENVSSDIYTAAYIVLDGTREMDSYSDEYDRAVQSAIGNIESRIKAQREKARYDSVLQEARTKLEDAETTMDDKFAEADKKFAGAWDDIAQVRKELANGEVTLADEEKKAAKKIAEARSKINSTKQKLAKAEEQLAEGEARLRKGEAELKANAQKIKEGRQQLAEERQQAEARFAAAGRQLDEAQGQLDGARMKLEPQVAGLKSSYGDLWPDKEWNALVNSAASLAATGADESDIAAGTGAESAALAGALPGQGDAGVRAALGMGKVIGGQQALDDQKSAYREQKESGLQKLAKAEAKLSAGETQIEAARRTIASQQAELKDGKAELADGKAELSKGEAKLNAEEADAKDKIADARKEMADGKEELAEGEAELKEQEQEYVGKKEEAEQKLSDAYAELDNLDMTQWYVQDRTSIDSYSSLTSDLSSIEAVGKVFPVIFLLVAILMSLTAMTRMVEEERGLIGTYKALGFGNGAVYRKYILFALMACLLGGVLGDLFGFVFMPKFVSVVLEELYSLPQVHLRFDLLYGVGGVLLFIAGIVGATILACRSELVKMPAALMRPKAPRAGARVFLERIPGIWNRLKFLNKVTVRNLFRYKKRLFMTIGGIMGCTALILCGFAIKDSIVDLAPKQYENIYHYDLMAVFEDDANDELTGQMSADSQIEDYVNLRIESVKVINGNEKGEKVQLMVIPEGAALREYISIENLDGKLIDPDDEGVLITRSAARSLGLKPGNTVSLQDMGLVQQEAVVSDVVQNYLGNTVYMTQKLYETLFGKYVSNGVLAHLSDAGTDQAAYAETLLENDSVLSAVSTAALRADFGFDLINAVVLLITVMAGGLAFVVLFTLSNTNISERNRELATIKVLGFYDKEVHQYVNKESLILTLIGILIGLPVGRILSGFLTTALNMPAMYFAVHVELVSYLISAAITFCFAVVVNWMTNRTLNRINMVEALKSVE
ncbi:putative ABC transport system permease protein [Fontibacillus phaseoli]|uniref:Putative ABC transport system permease protein n=1 Tax=Fontibacillus phaseoli TaxID=1416533 RepID=A0A369BHI0_9BACL|nr:ABC transporter permease [Fontibacillus phaseoli]RCX20725.1 putative ABC transport system permease protein [Fontibacillus phaseoli]